MQAEDGVALHGWLIPPVARAEARTPWVLVCHGNGGNISHRLDLALVLRRCGAGVFLFDYRGYGRSEGAPARRACTAMRRRPGSTWSVTVAQVPRRSS